MFRFIPVNIGMMKGQVLMCTDCARSHPYRFLYSLYVIQKYTTYFGENFTNRLPDFWDNPYKMYLRLEFRKMRCSLHWPHYSDGVSLWTFVPLLHRDSGLGTNAVAALRSAHFMNTALLAYRD